MLREETYQHAAGEKVVLAVTNLLERDLILRVRVLLVVREEVLQTQLFCESVLLLFRRA
jgi:hypothetical protein